MNLNYVSPGLPRVLLTKSPKQLFGRKGLQSPDLISVTLLGCSSSLHELFRTRQAIAGATAPSQNAPHLASFLVSALASLQTPAHAVRLPASSVNPHPFPGTGWHRQQKHKNQWQLQTHLLSQVAGTLMLFLLQLWGCFWHSLALRRSFFHPDLL